MGVVQTDFRAMLREAQQVNESFLCVGLDPDPDRFPARFAKEPESLIPFNRAIIEATSDLACCYKPNLGFYLPFGHAGIDALLDLRQSIPAHIPVLLDAKVGDLDSTSAAYARAYFDEWKFDAITVNPFMGPDSLAPLLSYAGRGVFVLAKTSNAGSGFLQDEELANSGERVSHLIARSVRDWDVPADLGLVVGATYPAELAEIRAIVPALPILIPGVGAQSGELEASVKAGLDGEGGGVLVNASRAINYASSGDDFQDAAREVARGLRDRINAVRTSKLDPE